MKYVWGGYRNGWIKIERTTPRALVQLISDQMAAARHPVTGEVLDSKSSFRRRTREAGCVELGNDAAAETSRHPMPRGERIRDSIARAWSELEQGRPAMPQGHAVIETRRYR